MDTEAPLIDIRNLVKHFGSVIALSGVSLTVNRGEVMCLLGDNGAGKSTLIKTLAGVHKPTSGDFLVEGRSVAFASPRDALDAGIATVYQDLAMIPLMSVTRNFFMGREPVKGIWPFRNVDFDHCDEVTREEMHKIGIDVRDPHQAVGTLSGGERQCVAIARAVYFGAKVLILDEPTSALGVAQTSMVLKYIHQVRAEGPRRDLHHAQRAPRLCGRRPLHRAQPRQDARHLQEIRDPDRGAAEPHGRRQGVAGRVGGARRDGVKA